MVGVQALGDGAGRHGQGAAPRGRLDGLEVQFVGRAWAYERLDLGRDLRFEVRLKPPFSASVFRVLVSAASNPESAHASQASQ
jgi:hypothetical protein